MRRGCAGVAPHPASCPPLLVVLCSPPSLGGNRSRAKADTVGDRIVDEEARLITRPTSEVGMEGAGSGLDFLSLRNREPYNPYYFCSARILLVSKDARSLVAPHLILHYEVYIAHIQGSLVHRIHTYKRLSAGLWQQGNRRKPNVGATNETRILCPDCNLQSTTLWAARRSSFDLRNGPPYLYTTTNTSLTG